MSDLLSEAVKASLTEKLLVFFIVWFFVKKTIQKHFRDITTQFVKIERNLAGINLNVKDLKSAMVNLEKSHDTRLDKIEGRVSALED